MARARGWVVPFTWFGEGEGESPRFAHAGTWTGPVSLRLQIPTWPKIRPSVGGEAPAWTAAHEDESSLTGTGAAFGRGFNGEFLDRKAAEDRESRTLRKCSKILTVPSVYPRHDSVEI